MRGTWRGYSFAAKVYELPSHMGINGGRISKLTVHDSAGREVLHYDRGWDTRPSAGSVLWRLVRELEQSPTR